LLRHRVAEALPGVELDEAPAANEEALALAHDPAYVMNVLHGRLSAREQRAIGFPWSEQLVERSRRSVGATIAASRGAMADGVAVNLAGGTHHAHSDRGQGYCVFNDVAVAARLLQSQSASRSLRVAIIDLDVHQGNGTASIFARDPRTFTLSLHGEANFPFRKESSDLDVALPDRTGDAVYLSALDEALSELRRRFTPEFVIYVAGADAHQDDRLGRLSLSMGGLRERDRRVFDFVRQLNIPVVVTMAGGYGRDIETTIAVHLNTIAEAFAHWLRVRPRKAQEALS
jgi:acetoin utilization deacetylase AcuC-like enzyme